MFVIGFPLLLLRLQTKYGLAKVLFFLFTFPTVAKMHSIIEEKLYPYTQDIIKVGTNTHCALHSDISRVYPY